MHEFTLGDVEEGSSAIHESVSQKKFGLGEGSIVDEGTWKV